MGPLSRMMLLAGCLAMVAAPADARRKRRRAKLSKRDLEAKQAFRLGSTLFAKKDYVGALEAFQRADFIKPHFLLQCNMARCYQRMGKPVESAEHYRRCLEGGADKKRRMGPKVKAALEKVEEKITWVEVTSPGKGGTVFVNGLAKGEAPQKIGLNPGTAVVEVRREGATPAGGTITTTGGETQVLELVPKDIPKPEPKTVVVHTPVPPVKRDKSRGLHQAWFWTGAAVTVGVAVAAIAIGATALQKKGDYEDNPTRQGYNDAKDRRLLANILFGATAAAAAGTTTIFFFTDWGKKKRERRKGKDEDVVLGIGVRGTF